MIKTMKLFFCPAAGSGSADMAPLAVAADLLAQAFVDDFLLHHRGEFTEGELLAVLQAAGGKNRVIVPGNGGTFAQALDVVRASRADLVYADGQAHGIGGRNGMKHFTHMLFKTTTVTLTHKIGRAKPVMGAQGQNFALNPHICAGAW